MFGFYGEEGGAWPNSTPGSAATMPMWPQGQAPSQQGKQQPNYGMVRMHPSRVIEFSGNELELRGKVGDGVNQAADLISATASIPSLNFIPLTTFGNWF
jgi:hypothetical protein